jgi:hypothetical protein
MGAGHINPRLNEQLVDVKRRKAVSCPARVERSIVRMEQWHFRFRRDGTTRSVSWHLISYNNVHPRPLSRFMEQTYSMSLMMCGQETRKSEIKNADAKCEHNDTSLITAAIILVIFIILSA